MVIQPYHNYLPLPVVIVGHYSNNQIPMRLHWLPLSEEAMLMRNIWKFTYSQSSVSRIDFLEWCQHNAYHTCYTVFFSLKPFLKVNIPLHSEIKLYIASIHLVTLSYWIINANKINELIVQPVHKYMNASFSQCNMIMAE